MSMPNPPTQVEFYFTQPLLSIERSKSSAEGEEAHYPGFSLNGAEYKIGDCAFLYPEDEAKTEGQHYIGQILKCFQDTGGSAPDPHCVEVAWFERRAHLDIADAFADECEASVAKEVVLLDQKAVNPIGCISGKAFVFVAPFYDEACRMAKSCGMDSVDWFFCRGNYNDEGKFVEPFEEMLATANGKRFYKRAQPGVVDQLEVVVDSDDVKRQRFVEEQLAAPMRRTGKLVSGRTCVECGATQTPQWREGPAGPKTLCNACGVRYGRSQQRANKRVVSSGLSRIACGSGGRNGRASKAARSDAAPPPRGAARSNALSASEEASQRPLRQAALMSASRTAAYARTGVFPLDSEELEMQMLDAVEDEEEEGPEVEGAAEQQLGAHDQGGDEQEGSDQDCQPHLQLPTLPPAQEQEQLRAREDHTQPEVDGGAPLLRRPLAALPLPMPLQQLQRGQAAGGGGVLVENCASFPRPDSPVQAAEPEGAGGDATCQVEVLLAEGEAHGVPHYAFSDPQLRGRLSPAGFTGPLANPPSADEMGAAAALTFGCETPQPLPPAAALAASCIAEGMLLPDGGVLADSGVLADGDADACAWMVMAGAAGPCCGADDTSICEMQGAPGGDEAQPAAAATGPSISGGGAACDAAAFFGARDGPCPHTASAPASPSARGDCALRRGGGGDGPNPCAQCYGAADSGLGCYGSCPGVDTPLDGDEYGQLGLEQYFRLGVDHFDALPAGVDCPPVMAVAGQPAVAASAARYCPEELDADSVLKVKRQLEEATRNREAAQAGFHAACEVHEGHKEARQLAREVELEARQLYQQAAAASRGLRVDLCGGGMAGSERDGAEMAVTVRS